MMSYAYGARSPHSHYDVILIVMSFATELAMPSVTDVQTYIRTDTLQHLIHKDFAGMVFTVCNMYDCLQTTVTTRRGIRWPRIICR